MPTGIYDRTLKSATERFWVKVDKKGPISESDGTRCWLWTGATSSKGYGSFVMITGSARRTIGAHRFAYEEVVGKVGGAQLDHRATCSKRCVQPLHLRPVTNKQNQENLASARADNRLGIRGVRFVRGRYQARVRHHGVEHHGGYFATAEEAESAVMALRSRLFTHNDRDRERQEAEGGR